MVSLVRDRDVNTVITLGKTTPLVLANCFKGKAQVISRSYDVVLGSASSLGVSRY